jgi:hypothetical protein
MQFSPSLGECPAAIAALLQAKPDRMAGARRRQTSSNFTVLIRTPARFSNYDGLC